MAELVDALDLKSSDLYRSCRFDPGSGYKQKLSLKNRLVFTVDVAQLVRASDCGSEGRRFESDLPPLKDSGETANFSVAVFFISSPVCKTTISVSE